jgi:phosphoglycolate phosphatase-like HAD superfamily hydrolase
MPFEGEPGLDVIALDCDGVVVESVEAKGKAFRKLFSAYPTDIQDAAEQSFHERPGCTRYENIAHCYRALLGQAISAPSLRVEAERFGRYAEELIGTAALVPGAGEFLERWARRCSLFVVSGVPGDELRRLLAERRLAGCFKAIYGAERPKSEWLDLIRSAEAVAPARMLFVGDTIADLAAATAAGVRFAGRVQPGRSNPFPPGACSFLVRDLHGLQRTLTALDGGRRHGPRS